MSSSSNTSMAVVRRSVWGRNHFFVYNCIAGLLPPSGAVVFRCTILAKKGKHASIFKALSVFKRFIKKKYSQDQSQ